MSTGSPRIVTDAGVDKALSFLRDNARAIGQAKSRLVKAQAMISHVEAILTLKSDQTSDTKRRAEARASERYLEAINEEAAAAGDFEMLRALREAAAATVEAWRSEQANYRAMKL